MDMQKNRCYGCMELTEEAVCPKCGWKKGQNNESHQLPVGTVLRDKYLIGRVLGQGGFGITYMAWDMDMDVPVCIKEFYPNTAVNRDNTRTTAVTCNTSGMEEGFRLSRERFLREAQSLEKFRDIPQIVSMYDYFQMNNTAYFTMEYVRGIDMAKLVRLRGGRMTMEEILKILAPVMDALQIVHDSGMIHRDISPDNIMLHPVEGPKLLDFGAVRTVMSPDPEKELTRSTEAILKNGFAPMEQYVQKGGLGPWTDVYAMSATIFYCLTGRIPESAPSRMLEDSPFDWTGARGITEEQKEIISRGMALKAKDRIGSVRELKEALLAAAPAPVVPVPEKPPVEEQSSPDEPSSADEVLPVPEKTPAVEKRKKKLLPIIAAVLLLVAAAVGGGMYWSASRIHVSGAELDDATLERLLLEDYSAIGYYAVTTKVSAEKCKTIPFPVGEAYEGLELLITDEEGTSVPAVTLEGTASADLLPRGCYLIQVKTAETEALLWSQWSETLPEGIDLNSATVEVDIQYHSRDKEHSESYYDTMDGWELLETFPNEIPYGEWSDWSETPAQASEQLEVEQARQFRFRSKEETTSTSSTMEGWISNGSYTDYIYGEWSSWSAKVQSASDTLQVESKPVYAYPASDFNSIENTTSSTTYWDSRSLPIGYVVWNVPESKLVITGAGSYSYTYYRSRSIYGSTTTYYYYRWTDWTEWDKVSAAPSDTVEVEERDVYRTREIYGDTAYRFWRWEPWTDWALKAPGPENEETEYEQRIVYRYIP